MLSDRSGSMVLLPFPFEVPLVLVTAAPEGIMRLPVVNGAEARRGLGAMMMFRLFSNKKRQWKQQSTNTVNAATTGNRGVWRSVFENAVTVFEKNSFRFANSTLLLKYFSRECTSYPRYYSGLQVLIWNLSSPRFHHTTLYGEQHCLVNMVKASTLDAFFRHI